MKNYYTNDNIANIATLNARGIKDKEQKEQLTKDAEKYKTKIMAIPETHIPDEEQQEELMEIDSE